MEHLIERFADASPTVRVDPNACVAPVRETLGRIFENQPVSITETPADQSDDIVVVRDGEVVAGSSTEEFLRSVLLINSDVYITGSRDLTETELPDMLKALEETPLRLRGYPASHSEKLLLITVSRAIERLAYEAGRGTVRIGFQRLSRLVDEPGTARVYERLSETDLDVHAYGIGDSSLPSAFDLSVHTGSSQMYRRCWFVIFEPPTAAGQYAGLFAIEREPNHWDGFWTFRPQRVRSLDRAIRRSA